MPREPKGLRAVRRAGQRGPVRRAYKRKYGKKRGCAAFFLVASAILTAAARRFVR